MLELAQISEIIDTLIQKGIIEGSCEVAGKLYGSTDGQVYRLAVSGEVKYVLKVDHPQSVSAAVDLHRAYAGSTLLAKLLYADPANTYMVYSYIEGTTHVQRGSKIKWLTLLVHHLLNHYEITQAEQWGGAGRLHDSWASFNSLSLEIARSSVGDLLPLEDYRKVKLLGEQISSCEDKYLLHGDTGVHNLVFREQELAGVIDPSPMAGPLIYDFTYAFCSSPDDLNLETLFTAYDQLKHKTVDRSRLIHEVIFQLYCRIGICARVHPQDLEDYLLAWENWRVHLV
ncbi:phosphotransferase [Paenibacillus sp. BAC0078]